MGKQESEIMLNGSVMSHVLLYCNSQWKFCEDLDSVNDVNPFNHRVSFSILNNGALSSITALLNKKYGNHR
jgi:hypothetical protein